MSDEQDLLTAILGADTDLCLSGGATGSDLQWGMCAGLAGHKVIHWSFDGHHTDAPEVEVVRLSPEQLAKADPMVAVAAKALQKGIPNKPWIKPLIQRNWYQVQWAQSVYAVCEVKSDYPQGGTAWAIEMYLARDCDHHLFVFDQERDRWLVWVDSLGAFGVTNADYQPPKPKGIWAGIGTRDLQPNGKKAIRDLMGYVKPTL